MEIGDLSREVLQSLVCIAGCGAQWIARNKNLFMVINVSKYYLEHNYKVSAHYN